MRRRAALSALGLGVLAAVLLSGCTTQNQLVAGSQVVVAVTDPFTSANPATSFGRGSETNADVALLTSTGFAYTDARGTTVADTSFGTAQLLSRGPLTVRYTVNPGVEWSDGTAIDASDLLLAWAANSGALNTPKFDDSAYVDAATGRYSRAFPHDVVFFDGAIGAGLEKATRTPVLGDDGRSVTVIFDSFVSDWATLLNPGVPAHVLAHEALHVKAVDPTAAKAAVLAAIQKKNVSALHALAAAWNDDGNLTTTPKNRALLVSSGPYTIQKISGTRVVLAANPKYTGSRRPGFETLILRVSPDPLVTAKLLGSGAIDVATPEPTAATVAALASMPGLTVTAGSEARSEHLDLQFADGRNGTFGDARVRRAFLDTVPREKILEEFGTAPGGAGAKRAAVLDSFVLRSGAPGYAQAIAQNGSRAYATPDLAAAMRLLAEAGVSSPQVCILYDPANPRRVSEFDLIQQSADRAGFDVTDCSSPDWQGLLGVAGAYDASLFAWDTTRLGSTAQASVFRSGATLANYNRYADQDADALIAQLATTDDPSRQTALLTRLDSRIWADAYGLPLYEYPTLTVVGSRVTGVTRSPLAASVFWNAWGWKPTTPSGSPANGH